MPDDAVEGGRQIRARERRVRRIVAKDGRHRLGGRVATERALAGQHLVEHGAECEEIRARVSGLPAHLLRRHVPDGAQCDAGLGHGRHRLARARRRRRVARQAEVEDLHAAVAHEEEVLRLQITMDDVLLVRSRQAVRDLRRDVERLPERQGPALQALAQRFPLQHFSDDEDLALVEPGVVHRENVRMRERGDGLRLTLETRAPIRIARKPDGQDLDGDITLQSRIARAIHLAHTTGADGRDDLVGTDARPGNEFHAGVAIIGPPAQNSRMPDTGRPVPGGDPDGRDVTALLGALRRGEAGALDRLLPVVYDTLRGLARRQLAREHGPRTLDATGLVHEAYLKLSAGGAVDAANRAHFLGVAARAMRQVLVEHARRRNAARRGGDWISTTLTEGLRGAEFDPTELIALNDALDQLEPRQRQVVECRFFAGMEEHEIATALGLTERTVRRDWVKARAWLYRSLYPETRS